MLAGPVDVACDGKPITPAAGDPYLDPATLNAIRLAFGIEFAD